MNTVVANNTRPVSFLVGMKALTFPLRAQLHVNKSVDRECMSVRFSFLFKLFSGVAVRRPQPHNFN